jgi:hypothetical protein
MSERNVARGSSTARGYSSRWRRLSERYRRFTPYCEIQYVGCQLVAVDVDHRVPIRAGGRSIWAIAQAASKRYAETGDMAAAMDAIFTAVRGQTRKGLKIDRDTGLPVVPD